MLHLQDITITHLNDLRTLVDHLSFTLPAGEKLAIIGEEGTGKSTLLQAIVDQKRILGYASVTGRITHSFSSMGYLPQSLEAENLQLTVTDYLYQDLASEPLDFNLLYKLSASLQIPLKRMEEQDQLLGTLSGGEKLKLQLLKILATDPDVLLLDEPTSDLDLETVSWLQEFLSSTDKTVLFISHDERLLTAAATSILHLELVQKRQKPQASFYPGSYSTYVEERTQRFAHQLQVANKEREIHAKKLEKNERARQSVEHALRHTKSAPSGRLLAKKMRTILAQKNRYEKEREGFTEIPEDMDTIHLFFSDILPLASNKRILSWNEQTLASGQTISLVIRGQEKIVITGKNGIGKTCLLQEILDDLQKNTSLSVGYMPQYYEAQLPPDIRPIDFLAQVASSQKARSLLASLQFTREEMTHRVQDLSSGQKAKCFLARMVLAKHPILLLDEPTRHFSPTSQPIIRQILQDYPGCIISVSHDRAYIEEVCPTHYQLTPTDLKCI